jgi:oligopeptide/dipeptide ABC transporter ATP-binding protein
MLTLQDVTVRYGVGHKAVNAVEGVNLTVPNGGTLGLVGESGSGKSSIAKAVVGLAPLVHGRLLLDGADYTSKKRRESAGFRRKVQMVFQDPYSSLNPRMTIGDALFEAQVLSKRSRSQRRAEAKRLLDAVGMPSTALSRYPFEFSGGQRQRVAIARALAVAPELIICDEVTSSLDVSVQATILNLLEDLQENLNFSCLFISHDLAAVRCMSDDVTVIYAGQIVETAPADQLFEFPRHPYTQSLLASIAEVGVQRKALVLSGDVPDPRNPPRGCRFHSRCPVGPLRQPQRTICIESDPQSVAERMEHEAACHFAGASAFQPPAEASTTGLPPVTNS